MGDLFGKVLPLALGGAISPTVLTVAVLTLSSAKRPVARGVAYALGFATVLVAFAAAGLAFLGRVNDDHAHHRGAVADTIDIVIGVVLLLFALRSVVARRTGVDTDAPKPPREHQVGLTASFVTGMVMMLTNITTIVLLIPMMKDVDRASASTGAKAVVFAGRAARRVAPRDRTVVRPRGRTRAIGEGAHGAQPVHRPSPAHDRRRGRDRVRCVPGHEGTRRLTGASGVRCAREDSNPRPAD